LIILEVFLLIILEMLLILIYKLSRLEKPVCQR
jgi:hypothetical protein